MGTRIILNGQEYASTDAMPPEVRQVCDQALKQLADTDHDGIPDIVQHGGARNVIGIKHTSITINGKTYDGPDQIPPALRQIYEQAMAKVDANRNGIPDLLEGGVQAGPAATRPAATDPALTVRTVRTQLTPGAGDRTWTLNVSARQLLTFVLLALIGAALVVLFQSG
jgi:hypothetical protein